MAKIEMDISEYEAMKENKVLLEKSLEKQEKLNQQIKDLQQEKIEDLKKNAMRVVKVNTTEVRQFVLRKRPDGEIIDQMRRLFNPNAYDPNYHWGPLIEQIQEAFFQIQEVTSGSGESIVTVHGLDEVRGEIRAEEEKKVKKEVERLNNKIHELDITEERNKTKILDANIIKAENKSLVDKSEKLIKNNAELSKHLDNMEDRMNFSGLKVAKALIELEVGGFMGRKQTILNARTVLSEEYVENKDK